MWLFRFTQYLLRHRVQALVLTLLITSVPIIGILGILIAAFITLTKGLFEGALFTLAATLPYFGGILITHFQGGDSSFPFAIAMWAGVGVAVLSNILTWVFAVMLYEKSPWSTIVQVAALLGILTISVLHLIYPNMIDWWGSQLQAYQQHVQELAGLKGTNISELQIEAINNAKYYATGLLMTAVLANALFQLVVARWWQKTYYRQGSLKSELHFIRLSPLAGVLFIFSGLFYYLGNSVVLDIMPVLCMLFAIAGMSLVHYFFGMMQSPTAPFWLALVYLMIIFSIPVSILLISLLALLDIWFNLRRRLKKV